MFGILFRNKIQMLRNSFFRDKRKKRWRKLLGIVGSLFLFWFMLHWIEDIFQVMLQSDLLPGTVTERIELFAGSIALIFNGLFLFLFMGGISISVHYLYTSADLTLLLGTPLKLSAVFSFKIFETIFLNTGIFFLIGGAILIGQGLLIDASPVYYLNMLIVGMLFISLPTMLAIFLTLGIVRLLPPRRIRELSSALTGIIGLGIWLVLQIFRISLVDQAGTAQFTDQTGQIAESIQLTQQFWTPGSLVSEFTLYYLNPIKSFPWLSFCGLIIGTTLLFYLCLNFSVREYLKTGTITKQTLLIKHARRHRFQINTRHLPSIFNTMMWKDFRLIYRHPQLSIQLLLMMAMILFISILMPGSTGQTNLTANFTENTFGYFFILFIIVAAQNASRLIPLEGSAFWLLRVFPARIKQFLWSKCCLGLLLNQALALITLVVITIYHQLSFTMFVHLFTLSIAINLSATSIGILIGSYYPRFDWEHPKRMLTSTGSFILTGLSILCFVIIIFLEFFFRNISSASIWRTGLMLLSLFILGLMLQNFVIQKSEKRLIQTDLNI